MNIDSNFPLQDMIVGVLRTAKTKLAAAEEKATTDQKVKKLIQYEKQEHGGRIPTVKEEEAEKTASDLTSPDYIEKLATAVDYLAAHADEIEPSSGVLQQALNKMASGVAQPGGSPVGPGSGPGALSLSKSIGGKQAYKKDKPKTDDASTSEHSTPLTSGNLPGGSTQISNDAHNAPGQNSGAVPHATYPAKGPLVAGPSVKTASVSEFYKSVIGAALEKQAFSITEAGHKLDSKEYGANAKAHHDMAVANEDYTKENPLLANLSGRAAHGVLHRLAGRHQDYAAKKHEKGHNAYNPFGGLLTKSRQEKEEDKEKSAAQIAREHILSKLAGEDVLKANISAGTGGTALKTTQAGQASPRQAGDAAGGFGNEARRLIASNKAAIDATKRDAKGPVKSQLKQVLEEPALNRSTDSKLHENLRNAGSAGVKIAAAQAFLTKIAQEGSPEERAALKAAIGRIKVAEAGMAPGGAVPAMTQTAEAGGSSDGCTCGSTGECRVCKLKSALSAAKGGAPGNGQGLTKEDCAQ